MNFLNRKNKNICEEGLKESEILGLKKYREINWLLKKVPFNGRFQKEKSKIKKECKEIFNNSFQINEKDWDILTVLKLFDRETYEHSIGVFLLASEKIKLSFWNDVQVKQKIEEILGEIDIFYRACLFHDIGKIVIPSFILKNSLSDKDWVFRFYRIIKKRKNKISFSAKQRFKKYNLLHFFDKIVYANNPKDILKIFQDKNLRPVQIIPLRHGISRWKLRKLRKDYGWEGNISLYELIKIHEKESYNILLNLGYKTEAFLARHHSIDSQEKNYNLRLFSDENFTESSIASLIHLADIQDALENDRYYHRAFSKLDVLVLMINDFQKKNIGKKIFHLWMNDEFSKLKKDNKFQKKIDKIRNKRNRITKKESKILSDWCFINDFFKK